MRPTLTSARLWRSLVAAATALLVLQPPASPVGAATVGAPAAVSAAEVVLAPADVGPDFVLVSSGETMRYGFSVRVQTLRRGAQRGHFVEPDGFLFVRSFAAVVSTPGEADRAFDEVAKGLGESAQEVPILAVGDRSRGAALWGAEPFDVAARIVLFRAGSTVGWVTVGGYEAPTSMDDVVSLAQIMAARASR